MGTKVERGKGISVLVEQAFPTCILVSFQHGDKTFRGVLLDESSQTSVIRTTPADVHGKADNQANLGLTTSRSTTCQTDLHHLPSGRVNTRSSAMMLRDGREGGSERITPVHKIRGIVERLTQRRRKLTPKPQPILESSPQKSQALKEDETGDAGSKQPETSSKQPETSNDGNGSPSKSFKRKLTDQSSEPPPKAARTTGTVNVSDKIHETNKAEEKAVPTPNNQLISSALSGKPPLFPILKLKRTSCLDNSYVAVTMFSPKQKVIQQGTESQEGTNTRKTPLTTSQDPLPRKHNTRFKGQKTVVPQKLGSKAKLSEQSNSAVIMKKDVTPAVHKDSPVTHIKTPLNDNATSSNAAKKSILQNYTRRQLKPRVVHHNMKIGDVAWGKVHGHPWWPCRVFAIVKTGSEPDGSQQVVKVDWYGSPTTSEISCSFLLRFQEHFKHLYKKKKPGAYQRAVKQAQHDLDVSFSGTQVMPA